jgi:hypothetical protein
VRSPLAQRFAGPLEQARSFVDAGGSELDALRLAVWSGEGDPAALREALEKLQRPDGSFPVLPGRVDAGPLIDTLSALHVLFDARVRRAESVERAVGFLMGCQAEDGSWCGVPADDSLATTALVAGALARSVYTRPDVLEAAGDWLAPRYDRERPAWGALAGLCAFFSSVDHEAGDTALQWSGRALERGYRAGEVTALETARVLLLCDAVGLPGAGIDPGELVRGVLAQQAEDGGWPGCAGAGGDRIEATLDAALALLRLPS